MIKKRYMNREWLGYQYYTLEKSMKEISKECDCHRTTISNWLKKFNISSRRSGPKKGFIPWNKGLKDINEGAKNPMWKGDDVGYVALHQWIRSHKPKSDKCEICGKKTKVLDCANISGKYKRDINDYKWLCKKCHFEKDNIRKNLMKGRRFKKGNIPWNKGKPRREETKKKISLSLKKRNKEQGESHSDPEVLGNRYPAPNSNQNNLQQSDIIHTTKEE